MTLVNSTISGFDHSYSHSSTGIYVGTFAQPGVALTLSTTNSSLTTNNVGVYVTEIGSSPSSLTWTGTNTSIAINTHDGRRRRMNAALGYLAPARSSICTISA